MKSVYRVILIYHCVLILPGLRCHDGYRGTVGQESRLNAELQNGIFEFIIHVMYTVLSCKGSALAQVDPLK